eukprot:3239997-Ditylum_brightwellii.AAC.2
MERYEYMRLRYEILPQEIIATYNLNELKTEDGWAGILANKLPTARLAEYGYYPVQHTPGLWRHKWRPGEEHEDHLINALKEYYEVIVDMEGKILCSINLDWDYNKHNVDLAMPGYIAKAQIKYSHTLPKYLQHLPPKHLEIKRIQDIVGTLLYYSRVVDPTLAAALSTIASQQATTTKQTEEACHQLLDYVLTYPNAAVCFMASNMILAAPSDASYLSESKARSRAARRLYLAKCNDEDYNNGKVLTLSTIIRHMVASASEAELTVLFCNAREAVPLCITLEEMGHPNHPPP